MLRGVRTFEEDCAKRVLRRHNPACFRFRINALGLKSVYHSSISMVALQSSSTAETLSHGIKALQSSIFGGLEADEGVGISVLDLGWGVGPVGG